MCRHLCLSSHGLHCRYHAYSLALYDPFGVDVPLNLDITHHAYSGYLHRFKYCSNDLRHLNIT